MIIKAVITKVNPKPFNSSEGGMINWFWYRAERIGDQVTIDVGSRREYKVGQEVTLDVEKNELANNKFRYKERIPKEILE